MADELHCKKLLVRNTKKWKCNGLPRDKWEEVPKKAVTQNEDVAIDDDDSGDDI
jgi:hypothetical protein